MTHLSLPVIEGIRAVQYALYQETKDAMCTADRVELTLLDPCVDRLLSGRSPTHPGAPGRWRGGQEPDGRAGLLLDSLDDAACCLHRAVVARVS